MVNSHSLASRPGTRVNHIADTLYSTNSVKMMQIDWWVFLYIFTPRQIDSNHYTLIC